MGFLEVARPVIADQVIGGATYDDYNNANARIGVGNGDAAFAKTQTGLQGGSTAFKGMDSGHPSRSSNVVTWKSTFDTSEANFTWEELIVDNGTIALFRHVEALGTKTSAANWIVTVDQTWDLP